MNNLEPFIQEQNKMWTYKNHIPMKEALDSFSFTSSKMNIENGIIKITTDYDSNLETFLRTFSPWKKGPFQVNDVFIDSEWRSDLKWDRIKDYIGDLTDKCVLDVGCNNGYYMFRLLEHNPRHVLGIDPVVRVKAQFDAIQGFLQDERLQMELLGAQHLDQMKESFDFILYMGILYHHRDPIAHLKMLKEALKPGGRVLIETIGIEGEESISLTPAGKYACMPNVWHVPTLNCLINWLEKLKFKNIEVISTSWDEVAEQRATSWSSNASYENFLDPNDSTRTIEGHPAPKRFALMVSR
jgi:tRNA (mo5U34)-methyltransferase